VSDVLFNLFFGFKFQFAVCVGVPCLKLFKKVKQYLQQPEKLFRRVRNEKGILCLSKAAKAYNPGQGIYRSSYKNAMRLTRTETNMAYRKADSLRWQQIDFILGIKIQLSGSHPEEDICDDLAGDYPKDFVFVGWHPQCLCYATSILPSQDEFIEMQKRKMAGDDTPYEFKGMIKDVPDNFKEWVRKNESRIEKARAQGTEPYFVRDNEKWVQNVINIAKDEDVVMKIFNDKQGGVEVFMKDEYRETARRFAVEHGLTDAERIAVNMYTNREYGDLNKALREENMTPELKSLENVLNRALDKIKPEVLDVYRGVDTDKLPKEFIQNYIDALNNKSIVIEKAFTSTSIKPKVAEEYGGDGVIFYYKSKTGRNIMPLSKWGDDEGEILFKSGTKFKVIKIEQIGRQYRIKMEEI